MINVQVNRIVTRLLYIARVKGFEPFNTFDDLVVYTRDSFDVPDVIAKVAASTACAKSDAPLVKSNA